jgi:myo-inositol catabolism protein IolH
VRIALDPFMHRHKPLPEVVAFAASAGYRYIELSPREDFMPFYVHPRADTADIQALRKALGKHNVAIAALLIGDYAWASPDENERRAAVRYWTRALEIAVELECETLAAEFGGNPIEPRACEAAFWRSLDELVPRCIELGLTLAIEPHPYNFVEQNDAAVNLIKAIGSPHVRYLYCVPHTFHMGGEVEAMIRYAAPVLAHVHVADTYDATASSGLRFIVNPHGAVVRVHQHMNIGRGDVPWETVFGTLASIDFDGILTCCVYGEEDTADYSAGFMMTKVQEYLALFSRDEP